MHPKQTARIALLTAESGEVCDFTNARRMYKLTKIPLTAEGSRKNAILKE
jgi:hypothetical protein